MALFHGRLIPFTVEVPASWAKQSDDVDQANSSVMFSDGGLPFLGIYEGDLVLQGLGEMSLADAVEHNLSGQKEGTIHFNLLQNLSGSSRQGLPVQLIIYTEGPGGPDEMMNLVTNRLLYVHEGRYLLILNFLSTQEQYEALAPLIIHVFNSLQVAPESE